MNFVIEPKSYINKDFLEFSDIKKVAKTNTNISSCNLSIFTNGFLVRNNLY